MSPQASLTARPGSSLHVRLTEQGPQEPAEASGLGAQPRSAPGAEERWQGGDSWSGSADRTLVRAPGGRSFGSGPAPRRASRPAPSRPPPRASKASGAPPWLPHFHSPQPLQLSVWLWSSHSRQPVPWMPRSSPCWPWCWLRSASATVSVLAAEAGPAPGSRLGSGRRAPRGAATPLRPRRPERTRCKLLCRERCCAFRRAHSLRVRRRVPRAA